MPRKSSHKESKRAQRPSEAELEARKTVGINAETVTNITSTDYPGHYPGEDYTWNTKEFEKHLKVQFHKNEKYDASFSVVGIDASIANAFRRILIAEVPTFAIERVYVYNNTSVISDEVLAQRLGLIPLAGSLEGFRRMTWYRQPEGQDPGAGATDSNVLVMRLQVECSRIAKEERDRGKDGGDDDDGGDESDDDPTKVYRNAHVYARDIQWLPQGRQEGWFEADEPVRPAHPDILVAKLRHGQVLELEMHCVKGTGGDHAKFSPVATASYRMLPTIDILRPIVGPDAKKFARCFPKGVIGLDRVTPEDADADGANAADAEAYAGHVGEHKAVVRDPMLDTVSRECLRHDEFRGKVRLGRRRDHFIFSVESTGQYDSDALFLESVKTLRAKCSALRRDLAHVVR